MSALDPIKPARPPCIGLYSIGHAHYWEQFDGLLDRLVGYGRHIEGRLGQWGQVHNVGMIDDQAKRLARPRSSARRAST